MWLLTTGSNDFQLFNFELYFNLIRTNYPSHHAFESLITLVLATNAVCINIVCSYSIFIKTAERTHTGIHTIILVATAHGSCI